MSRFAEKVKASREALKLNQEELASLVGTTRRTIVSYESGNVTPHSKNLQKLATALGVTVSYLTDDSSDNPKQDIEKEPYVQQALDEFGKKAAGQLAFALKTNAALFAGGNISEDELDNFYAAVTEMYLSNRRRARAAREGRKATKVQKN